MPQGKGNSQGQHQGQRQGQRGEEGGKERQWRAAVWGQAFRIESTTRKNASIMVAVITSAQR